MAFKDYLPFQQATALKKRGSKKAQVLPLDDQKVLAKNLKIATLALGYQGLPGNVISRTSFEEAPYDLDRIIQAIDTDSYARQAFSKYKELFWKEGWEIVSENPEAAAYIWQRIDFFEIAMRRPFQDFLVGVVDQLVKFSNVFIAKARGDMEGLFPQRLEGPENKDPIIGYYIIPAETVEIKRDKHNRPKWYRQRTRDAALRESRGPQWNANEVIHLSLDKKEGHAFGTPFMISAMDDIVALRQIEEDLQNLVHRELFPTFTYTVGTDEHPADDDEVAKVVAEIESIRTEGAIVLPHRHVIDVVGAEGNALDASEYLTHFKQRVAIALGLYPHHLGMTSGGNRDATDRLDTALYDKIKLYQRYVADAIRLFIFNELLIEGGFDPLVTPTAQGVSDRCLFRFREIDTDTQIKKETHSIQKATSNLETIGESRLDLNREPELDEADTIVALQARMTPDQPVQTKRADGTPGQPKLADVTPKPAQKDSQASSQGGRPNPRNIRKGAGNVIRPQNQFGRRTSPNIRRSSDYDNDLLKEIVELLSDNDSEEKND